MRGSLFRHAMRWMRTWLLRLPCFILLCASAGASSRNATRFSAVTSSGARNIEKILSQTLLPELSAEVLARLAEGQPISRVKVGMNPSGSFCYSVT